MLLYGIVIHSPLSRWRDFSWGLSYHLMFGEFVHKTLSWTYPKPVFWGSGNLTFTFRYLSLLLFDSMASYALTQFPSLSVVPGHMTMITCSGNKHSDQYIQWCRPFSCAGHLFFWLWSSVIPYIFSRSSTGNTVNLNISVAAAVDEAWQYWLRTQWHRYMGNWENNPFPFYIIVILRLGGQETKLICHIWVSRQPFLLSPTNRLSRQWI
jgi:hypothetical protein